MVTFLAVCSVVLAIVGVILLMIAIPAWLYVKGRRPTGDFGDGITENPSFIWAFMIGAGIAVLAVSAVLMMLAIASSSS